GADVNAQGGEYGSALQAASVKGHDKTVQILLDRGADVNAQGGEYGSALQAASVKGHDKILDHRALTNRCLDLGAKVDATDKYGETALHYAAEAGHLDIVEILIQANADRTVLDSHGRTALDCARGAGPDHGRRSHPDVVTYLEQWVSEIKPG
ncbi:hypothetical protein D6D19_10716, partial [Aureobasidium pullulans]